jgi:glycosyltransferase involved in cell wall biosynthesis
MNKKQAIVKPSRQTVGVVILNYNYAHYVSQAIESVLDQSSPFDEIYVVDDGSTDNSLEVIRRYTPQITILAKPNGGMMSAAFAGLEKITTEYVYILDSDDFVSPHFVEKIMPHLLNSPVKLHCQLVGVDDAGKLFDSIFPSYPPGYNTEQMLEDNENIGFYICPPQSGNIYRRDYLQRVNFSSLLPNQVVDGAPALSAPYFGCVVTIEEPLAYYRSHGNSMSSWSTPTQKLFKQEIDIFYQVHWQEACRLVGLEQPPFGDQEPLYILERRLMSAGLAGKNPGLKTVRAFQRRTAKTHFPRQHKRALVIWAGLFLIPSASFRHYLVRTRRSAKGRSPFLRRVLRFLRP